MDNAWQMQHEISQRAETAAYFTLQRGDLSACGGTAVYLADTPK
jgi:hypothetical protein